MPLYLEIVDHYRSAHARTLPDPDGDHILGSWTSEETGETVRLVDAPEGHGSPPATVRTPRILFY